MYMLVTYNNLCYEDIGQQVSHLQCQVLDRAVFFTCSDVSIGFFSYLITVYKLEDLPGCAVPIGSVGGHIGCKVNCFF